MKKGQVQLQESIMVMVVFVVIILIALIVFYRFTYASIEADNTKYLDSKFIDITKTIPSMTEIRCSKLGIDEECLDLDKVRAFYQINTNYRNVFGLKNISLIMVYPGNENNQQIYLNKPRNTKNSRIISTYVSVYDSSQDKYKIARLVIEEYR